MKELNLEQRGDYMMLPPDFDPDILARGVIVESAVKVVLYSALDVVERMTKEEWVGVPVALMADEDEQLNWGLEVLGNLANQWLEAGLEAPSFFLVTDSVTPEG